MYYICNKEIKSNIKQKTMKRIRKVDITKEICHIFNLPCVTGVYKGLDGNPLYYVKVTWLNGRPLGKKVTYIAKIGDVLIEYADGTWELKRN